MTTVGYGDKTPRTFPARLFSVVWILIGIVAFGLLTSELTGRIVKANSPPSASMKGVNVGVLRYREHDAYVVSTHGGKIVHNDEQVDNFQSDLLELLLKLKHDEIQGFVLDTWTMDYAVGLLANMSDGGQETDLVNFYLRGTTRVEKSNKGKELSYGLLIKHKQDYDYFRAYVEGNQIAWYINDSQEWITIKREDAKEGFGNYEPEGSFHLFSAKGDNFEYSMIAVVVMVVVIIVFGLVYELMRKSFVCSRCGILPATTSSQLSP